MSRKNILRMHKFVVYFFFNENQNRPQLYCAYIGKENYPLGWNALWRSKKKTLVAFDFHLFKCSLQRIRISFCYERSSFTEKY